MSASADTLREEDYAYFFNESFDMMAVVGSDGVFKRINPAFERVLGYPESEIVGQPVSAFLHPDDIGKTRKGIQVLAEGQARLGSINRYRCKGGDYRWFSWNTRPIADRLYAVGRDITEQVQAEERIQRLNAELELRNENLERKVQERVSELQRSEAQLLQLQKMDAIGRLAGGIAHDFNNMLAVITLCCDMLQENGSLDASARKTLQNILATTQRASALTRQLLVFSRQQVAQPQVVNLTPLLQQLGKMLTRLIGENIKFVLKLGDGVKSISADPSQMEQVVLNLVVNARDAMPDGGTVTVETSNVYLDEAFTSTHLSVNPGHYVLLTVTDTGTGMDAETLSKIFDPFFTTKPVGKGTGIGLATTYGIVKQSKGTIWVYSELGKGTAFKIYLPVADAVAAEPVIAATKAIEPGQSRTILLVEDDENLRTGFTATLEGKGYRVLVAADGQEALRLCDQVTEPIHLLITDMIMPGLSGPELARQVVTRRPELPVLYMSGYTSDTLENAGADRVAAMDFLQKPFGTSALLRKVQDILSRG